MSDEFDISPHLKWRDGLPAPRWDWIELKYAPPEGSDSLHEFWTGVARQWLVALRDSLAGYTISESEHFLCLEANTTISRFAEHCRSEIGSRLKDVAQYASNGKHVVIVFRDLTDYYRYVSLHTPEGEQGTSGGMHPQRLRACCDQRSCSRVEREHAGP